MKNRIVGFTKMAESTVTSYLIQKVMLSCGIVSSLFYASMDVIGGTRWQEYNWLSQEFSQLSAIGAPSRPLHLVLNPIYTLLVIAFGLAIGWAAGQKRALRVVGGSLIVYALVSFVWPQFFPEDLNMPVSTFTNTMHIIITIVIVLSWILILGFGSTVFGLRFRLYTIGTLLTVLIFGVSTGPQAAALIAGRPAPWLGLTERINIYSFMLWVVVLAITLLRATESREVFSSRVADSHPVIHA